MMNTPELVKRWKVRTSVRGTVLTLNGKEYELGTSGPSIAFEIERCASGWNAPETEHTIAINSYECDDS